MQRMDLAVQNEHGLHARPAANFVQLAQTFECDITLVKAGRRASAKSILAVLTLDVRPNDVVTIQAEGMDEKDALAALAALAGRNFDAWD